MKNREGTGINDNIVDTGRELNAAVCDNMGTIYLLHFDQRIGRNQHYLGWTRNLDQRLDDHRTGRGGKTTARFRAAGIGFELAAQWSGSPDDEKRLKNKSLRSLCAICKERTMTVLEVMQQNADATRKVTMSLTDLNRATKNSRSRVRQELKALLDEGKVTVASKGDAGQNKTVYQLALCVPLPATVQENCAQHSAAQSNRIAEQDTTKLADSIELGTVPPHSAPRTVPTGAYTQSPGPSGNGGCGQNPEVSRATSMPPALLFFKDVEGMGPCLDLTRHYIADLEQVKLALLYPEWSAKHFLSGMLRVLHISYRDSRVEDTFHAILFFIGEDLDANFCRGHKLDSTSLPSLSRHTLTYHVRSAFPTAVEVHAQVCRIDQYAQALYDVRRFCIHCAGSSLPAGMFPGFEYVPYERPTSPNVSTAQSVADPACSAGPLSKILRMRTRAPWRLPKLPSLVVVASPLQPERQHSGYLVPRSKSGRWYQPQPATSLLLRPGDYRPAKSRDARFPNLAWCAIFHLLALASWDERSSLALLF